MSTSPAESGRPRSRLTWLRLLGAGLLGVAGLFLVLAVETALGSGTLSHAKWVVVLAAIVGCGLTGGFTIWAWWRLAGRYDSSGQVQQASTGAFAPHQGPDLASPGRVFVEGGFAYQVRAMPALSPVAVSRGDVAMDAGSALFQALLAGVANVVTRPFDRRWKVVVSRRLVAAGHLWSVVKIEFFATPGAAEARAIEILSDWDSKESAALDPLTRSQLRTARRPSP